MNECPEDEERSEKDHSINECVSDFHNGDKIRRGMINGK